MQRYRGYRIEQHWEDPKPGQRPQPDTYVYSHPDYDGPEDPRCGAAPTIKDVHEEIDELVRCEIAERLEDMVPAPIADFAIEVCLQFNLGGICDPMYVANIAALEFDQGDGAGTFRKGMGNQNEDSAIVLLGRLMHSYSSSIRDERELGRLINQLSGDLASVAVH